MIARYVLKADRALAFHSRYWIKDDGTVKGLNKLTSLTRTCRQLHSELSALVWEVNTLQLEYLDPGDPDLDGYRANWNFLNVQALKLFLRNTEPSKLRAILVTVPMGHLLNQRHWIGRSPLNDNGELFEVMALIEEMLPGTRITVTDSDWYLQDNGDVLRSNDVSSFTAAGAELLRVMDMDEFNKRPRKWTVRPLLESVDIEKTKQKLIAAGVADAAKWIDEGL